jgi:ArsR family transcriptional regulator
MTKIEKVAPEECCVPTSPELLSDADAVELAKVMAALSDPVRLRIYSIIVAEGEVCGCNLEGPLGKSQPTISHHTRKLAEVGLIAGAKRGRWMWWHAVPTKVAWLRGALTGLEIASGSRALLSGDR